MFHLFPTEILRQEGGSFKRKPTEHWAKRMGNRNINMKTGKGVSISTVGVDIGDWTFEKRDRSASAPNQGSVVFRTWDFGGQTEYYATHQYFLSKRSLYIVVWKVSPHFTNYFTFLSEKLEYKKYQKDYYQFKVYSKAMKNCNVIEKLVILCYL